MTRLLRSSSEQINLFWKVLGAVLVLAGLGLLAVTENNLLDYRAASERHGGEVVDLGTRGQPDRSLDGRMVHVSGPLHVVAPPRDDDFNQSTATPILRRHVEMFQWREIVVGGEAYYELDWDEQAIESSRFAHPAGHANPGAFPLQGKEFVSGEVNVGPFMLSPRLIHALPGSQWLTPDMRSLPANLAASFSAHGHYLVTSEHAASPRLGDLRVSWETVPLQGVTVVAQLQGSMLSAAPHADDGKGFEVQVGDRPLVDVFADLPVPPEALLPRRFAALLLVAFGVLVLFRERRERASDLLLPIGLAALLVGAVAGVIWMGGGGHLCLYWFLLAASGLACCAWPLWCRYRRDG